MYILVELQTNKDNQVASLVTKKNTREEAESAYYSVLAAAAVSEIPLHACMLMSNEGFPIMHECFHHNLEQ